MAQEVCDGVLPYLTTNDIYEKCLGILHEIFQFQIKTTNSTWQGALQIHPNAMTLTLGSQPNLGQNKEKA
jgi:hypothetical protein